MLKKVHIIQNQPELLCIDEFKSQIKVKENISVHTNCQISSIDVDNSICLGVTLSDSNIVQDLNGILIYVQIGQDGNGDILKSLVSLENGFVKSDIISDIKGLYFAGDIIVKGVRQIATAVNDGCLAAIKACAD